MNTKKCLNFLLSLSCWLHKSGNNLKVLNITKVPKEINKLNPKVHDDTIHYLYLGNIFKMNTNSDKGGLVEGGKVVLLVVPGYAQTLLWALHTQQGRFFSGECTVGYNDFNNLVAQTCWWLPNYFLRHNLKKKFSVFEPSCAHLNAKFRKNANKNKKFSFKNSIWV